MTPNELQQAIEKNIVEAFQREIALAARDTKNAAENEEWMNALIRSCRRKHLDEALGIAMHAVKKTFQNIESPKP
jgi:hypothetical protein